MPKRCKTGGIGDIYSTKNWGVYLTPTIDSSTFIISIGSFNVEASSVSIISFSSSDAPKGSYILLSQPSVLHVCQLIHSQMLYSHQPQHS